MRLLDLLPFVSLALALPHVDNVNTKRQTSCNSQYVSTYDRSCASPMQSIFSVRRHVSRSQTPPALYRAFVLTV